LLLLCAAAAVPGQDRLTTEQIVENARLQSVAYSKALGDLIGEELKTFETRNLRDALKRTRRIQSDILIYRSGISDGSRAELRIVKAVNDKPVPDAAARGERLIAELEKTSTVIGELNRLQRESTRYDDTVEIYGVTLNQATVLHRLIRPVFRFEATVGEALNGRKVFVVNYLQTEPTPTIAFNPPADVGALITINTKLPRGARVFDLRLRGTLWIDVETFRVWREERDVILAREPALPLITSSHYYAVSEFGVLLPTRIYFSINKVERKDGALRIAGRQTALFTYSNFRRTKVEIRITDDGPADAPR
jgi:hypothetical protein